jgi:flagellar biosynthesis component FlhA
LPLRKIWIFLQHWYLEYFWKPLRQVNRRLAVLPAMRGKGKIMKQLFLVALFLSVVGVGVVFADDSWNERPQQDSEMEFKYEQTQRQQEEWQRKQEEIQRKREEWQREMEYQQHELEQRQSRQEFYQRQQQIDRDFEWLQQ